MKIALVASYRYSNTPIIYRTKTMWLIGSLGVDRRRLNAWRRLFHGGVFVEPHMPELREFREHFLSELQVIARAINHHFRKRTSTHRKKKKQALISEIACKFPFYDLRDRHFFQPGTQVRVNENKEGGGL